MFNVFKHESAAWGRGPCPSWIFTHDTDIVDRSIIVLFFGLFCYFSVFFPLPPPSPGRGLIMLFLLFFCYFLVIFQLTPPGNFSADNLVFKLFKYKINYSLVSS